MAKSAISKEKMRFINQRAHSLAQDVYALYRLKMIELAAKDDDFNPDKWQLKEDRDDKF